MKKKIVSLLLIATMCFSTFTGCGSVIKSKTIAINEGSNKTDNLYDGQFYVMTAKENKKISKNKANEDGVTKYTPVYAGGMVGSTAESAKGSTKRLFYTTENKEYKIPTLYKGDALLYNSSQTLPQDIYFERMADDGYSVGIYGAKAYGTTNLVAVDGKSSEAGAIPLDDATAEIASLLSGDNAADYVYLSKIGKKKLTPDDLTSLGTIKNLNVNDPVNITYSVGTQQTTSQAKANVHFWHCMEYFKGTKVTLINDNLSIITIPEYFKTGYYVVQGVGMFRYVDGKSWDKDTDFNEPIIELDDEGQIINNPATATEKEEVKKESSNESTNDKTAAYSSKTVQIAESQQLNVTATYLLADEEGNVATKTPYVQITSENLTEPIVKTLTSGETVNYLYDEKTFPAGTYKLDFYNFENCSDVTIEATVVNAGED